MKRPRTLLARAVVTAAAVAAAVAAVQLATADGTADKLAFARGAFPPGDALTAPAAILKGGNGIYRLSTGNAGSPLSCGAWTATTGALHPAGAGLDVIWGGGQPLSSYTTLHSYHTNVNYTTGGLSDCTRLCGLVAPAVTPLTNGGVTVGFRSTWTFTEGRGPQIEFVQEIVVEGPVDGSETVDSSVIRETHQVRNLGPGGFRFGLRKLWDLSIGSDDGPWLASCASPGAGCDRALDLTRSGTLAYPPTVAATDDPATALCPAGVEPNAPEGCDGAPTYVVAASVTRPWTLTPRPTPPDVLQYSAWSDLFGDCWLPAPADATTCGANGFPTDDTAIAYVYGMSLPRALRLAAGSSASFTQYLGAGLSSCPAIISAPGR